MAEQVFNCEYPECTACSDKQELKKLAVMKQDGSAVKTIGIFCNNHIHSQENLHKINSIRKDWGEAFITTEQFRKIPHIKTSDNGTNLLP